MSGRGENLHGGYEAEIKYRQKQMSSSYGNNGNIHAGIGISTSSEQGCTASAGADRQGGGQPGLPTAPGCPGARSGRGVWKLQLVQNAAAYVVCGLGN